MTEKTLNRMVLKLHRVAASRSQLSLAKEVGRSQSWLCRLERGLPGSTVTARDLQNLAAALGVSPGGLEGK